MEDDEGIAGGDDDFGVRRDTKLLASIGVQDPFQPGSTPVGGTGEARFLCYNLIGNITTLEEQSAASIEGAEASPNAPLDKIHIVQLNYTDQTKHKASKFRDFFGFAMAAMGAHGAVFARSVQAGRGRETVCEAREAVRSQSELLTCTSCVVLCVCVAV